MKSSTNLKSLSAIGLMTLLLLFVGLRFEHFHQHQENQHNTEQNSSEEHCIVCDFQLTPFVPSEIFSIEDLISSPLETLKVAYTREAYQQFFYTAQLRGPPHSIL